MIPFVLSLALALTTAGAAPSAAQQPVLKAPEKCIKCHDLGRRPCPEHPAAECEWELKTIYCSEIAGCATCGGVGWIDCNECIEPATDQWLEMRRAKVPARKTALKFIADAMKREVRIGESDHCVIVWELGELKVDRRRLGPHELTHLYLERMEVLHADFKARLQVTDKHFGAKCELYVWGFPADHQACGSALCDGNAKGGVKFLGARPRYTVLGTKQNFQNDEELHRNLVHSMTHLLLSNVTPAAWVGNVRGGWMDEGLSHFFEDRYWGICDNYCYQEQNSNVDFKSGKFRLAVRRMVAEDKAPPAAEVFEQNVDTLTLPMHAVSMSYVDFLLQKDGAKFYELVKRLKKKMPTGDALQEVYGMRTLEFEASWKNYVLATYPTR
jgi:hypothetical protein